MCGRCGLKPTESTLKTTQLIGEVTCGWHHAAVTAVFSGVSSSDSSSPGNSQQPMHKSSTMPAAHGCSYTAQPG